MSNSFLCLSKDIQVSGGPGLTTIKEILNTLTLLYWIKRKYVYAYREFFDMLFDKHGLDVLEAEKFIIYEYTKLMELVFDDMEPETYRNLIENNCEGRVFNFLFENVVELQGNSAHLNFIINRSVGAENYRTSKIEYSKIPIYLSSTINLKLINHQSLYNLIKQVCSIYHDLVYKKSLDKHKLLDTTKFIISAEMALNKMVSINKGECEDGYE